MNIFYLHPNPVIAASMHCDQHLHKMILESAQLLSSTVWARVPSIIRTELYKQTHENHPCTEWCKAKDVNAWYVVSLASELDEIRQSLGASPHASMKVIEVAQSYLVTEQHTSYVAPIFCGPAIFKLDNARYPTIPEKYQAYYKFKAKQWALDGKPRMSYRNRPLPAFLQGNEYVTHS